MLVAFDRGYVCGGDESDCKKEEGMKISVHQSRGRSSTLKLSVPIRESAVRRRPADLNTSRAGLS